MKDIVIRHRFVFAPNFRKAVAHHLGCSTVSNETIKGFITTLVEAWERDLESEYYTSGAADNDKGA